MKPCIGIYWRKNQKNILENADFLVSRRRDGNLHLSDISFNRDVHETRLSMSYEELRNTDKTVFLKSEKKNHKPNGYKSFLGLMNRVEKELNKSERFEF